jgi:hypothetical protein
MVGIFKSCKWVSLRPNIQLASRVDFREWCNTKYILVFLVRTWCWWWFQVGTRRPANSTRDYDQSRHDWKYTVSKSGRDWRLPQWRLFHRRVRTVTVRGSTLYNHLFRIQCRTRKRTERSSASGSESRIERLISSSDSLLMPFCFLHGQLILVYVFFPSYAFNSGLSDRFILGDMWSRVNARWTCQMIHFVTRTLCLRNPIMYYANSEFKPNTKTPSA